MFKAKTVILVGAGASAEFGVPTGRAVYLEAASLRPRKYNERIAGFSFQQGFEEFLKSRANNGIWTKFDEFKMRVDTAVTPSIDRLAWLNGDISELCKAFSAWCILRAQYTEEQVGFDDYGRDMVRMNYLKKHPHLQPLVDGNQNWIARCADKWLGQANDHSELNPEVLTFVTFNYDRILEDAFSHFVWENDRFDDAPAERLPEVLHVHGSFPGYPDTLTEADVWAAKDSIKYIEEGGDAKTIRLAKDKLEQAEHIISVGFDFDPQNVQLLGLSKFSKKLHALNFNGNEAFDNRVLSLGTPKQNILRGTDADRIGASRAADLGYFDRAELFALSRPTIRTKKVVVG